MESEDDHRNQEIQRRRKRKERKRRKRKRRKRRRKRQRKNEVEENELDREQRMMTNAQQSFVQDPSSHSASHYCCHSSHSLFPALQQCC